jgi:hypothetical protein
VKHAYANIKDFSSYPASLGNNAKFLFGGRKKQKMLPDISYKTQLFHSIICPVKQNSTIGLLYSPTRI